MNRPIINQMLHEASEQIDAALQADALHWQELESRIRVCVEKLALAWHLGRLEGDEIGRMSQQQYDSATVLPPHLNR